MLVDPSADTLRTAGDNAGACCSAEGLVEEGRALKGALRIASHVSVGDGVGLAEGLVEGLKEGRALGSA